MMKNVSDYASGATWGNTDSEEEFNVLDWLGKRNPSL